MSCKTSHDWVSLGFLCTSYMSGRRPTVEQQVYTIHHVHVPVGGILSETRPEYMYVLNEEPAKLNRDVVLRAV
jgi:hypothetical protein